MTESSLLILSFTSKDVLSTRASIAMEAWTETQSGSRRRVIKHRSRHTAVILASYSAPHPFVAAHVQSLVSSGHDAPLPASVGHMPSSGRRQT